MELSDQNICIQSSIKAIWNSCRHPLNCSSMLSKWENSQETAIHNLANKIKKGKFLDKDNACMHLLTQRMFFIKHLFWINQRLNRVMAIKVSFQATNTLSTILLLATGCWQIILVGYQVFAMMVESQAMCQIWS